MTTYNMRRDAAARLSCLALLAVMWCPLDLRAGAEEAFPVLQVGTRTYTNVTVTTKAKNYVFIFHTGGMTSIKVAELSADIQEKLGYGSAEKHPAPTNSPAAWAKATVATLDTPQVKEIRHTLQKKWQARKTTGTSLVVLLCNPWVIVLAAGLVLLYVLHCYCFKLICQKTGHPPGLLVWLPVVQFFPLLRAAGMSGWWFVAYLLPLLNLVTFIVWAINIVKARSKSPWAALLLILPPTAFIGILYLAFSDGAGAKRKDDDTEVMSLQTV